PCSSSRNRPRADTRDWKKNSKASRNLASRPVKLLHLCPQAMEKRWTCRYLSTNSGPRASGKPIPCTKFPTALVSNLNSRDSSSNGSRNQGITFTILLWVEGQLFWKPHCSDAFPLAVTSIL